METPPGGSGNVRVTKFSSPAQAKASFQTSGSKLGIGDDSSFRSGGDSRVLKNEYVFSVYWYCFCVEKTFLTEDQAKDILSYAVSQVQETPKPTASPTPTAKPQRISMSPITVSAGVATDVSDEGVVDYADNALVLTLKGTDLRNISISTDNQGIKVDEMTLQNNQTARVNVRVRPEAQEGNTKVTITQPGQSPITLTLRVTIDGNQYLNRELNDTGVTLYGHWKETAPNKEVVDLKLDIEKGLQAVKGSAYQKLKLKFNIYKSDVWKVARVKYCADNSRVYGCTKDGSSPIYMAAGLNNTTDIDLNNPHGATKSVANLMLHESAHKLHYSLLRTFDYLGVPLAFKSPLTKEWHKASGTINKRTCTYLPIISRLYWSKGDAQPRCGFVVAYGASNYNNKNFVIRFQEDIASMTELLYFDAGIRKRGDFPNDPRYKQKEAILRKYGFLQ